MDNINTDDKTHTKMKYGVIVILVQDEEIFLSRRLDTPTYNKKWQFINGKMHVGEVSIEAATRIIEKETGLVIDKERLHFTSSLSIAEIHEFYYIYIVSLSITEKVNHELVDPQRTEWRPFELQKAAILDLAPGLRQIVIKMYSSLMKWKHQGAAVKTNNSKIDKSKTQKLPTVSISQEQQQQEQYVQGCCGV